jgi:hypothetical protein
MSNFGLPRETLKDARSKLPPIKLSSFIDPREPWVLVPDGNLLVFFHWVPKNLRVGPWSRLALPTLAFAASVLWYYRPRNDMELHDLGVDYYPEIYSNVWWYNFSGFLFMLGIIAYIMMYRTKGAILTYTLISWVMNMIRHGINAIIPCLKHANHFLLKINHVLRFPALASASITFLVWNAVLFPVIYNYAFDTKDKRANFLKFNCSYRMVQQHICNIIYAVLNTIVSSKETKSNKPILFELDDLWRGAASIFLYGIFYLVVLDRIGVHIYPVFSPRTNYVVITWCTVFVLVLGVYKFWNLMILQYWDSLLRLDILLSLNFTVVVMMSFVYKTIE